MNKQKKVCRRCNTELPLTEFYRAAANKDGYQNICKSCRGLPPASNRRTGTLIRSAIEGDVCSHPKCGVEIIGLAYPARLRGVVYCSAEHRLQDQVRLKQHRRREQFPEEERWAKIWGRFRITKTQWLALLIKQKGRCAICGTKNPRQSGKYFHTDHTEERGFVEVRGLLCSPCNQGLGYFQDDPEILASAITYLTLWREG
jgi:hypothetical protein